MPMRVERSLAVSSASPIDRIAPVRSVAKVGVPPLLVDHTDFVALAGHLQHSLNDIVAERAVHPAGTQNQVILADFCDGGFASELGGAVDVDGIGCIGFDIGRTLAAVRSE